MGGEDEAADYVQERGFDWLTTPGVVDWFTKVAAEMGVNADAMAISH